MADTVALPTITLRSLDAGWNYERWERELPDDGNRYEVIEGILYTTTAPSYFHQWIVRRLDRYIGVPLEQQELAYAATAPIGVLMPGLTRYSRILCWYAVIARASLANAAFAAHLI